jgi:hypothetical protein
MTHLSNPIEEGDLLAHLEGEYLAHVVEALARSPELRMELAALRETIEQVKQEARRLRTAYRAIDDQDMVDVVTGQATAAQRLGVAAAVRRNKSIADDLDELQRDYKNSFGGSKKGRFRLPRVIGRPVFALGTRAEGIADTSTNTYYSAELTARVTLRVIPRIESRLIDQYTVEAYVTLNDRPFSDARATLRRKPRSIRRSKSDASGFVRFERLSAGDYELDVDFPTGTLVVPEIHVNEN